MLKKLLPPRIDNTYRGHRLALWLFAAVVFVRITQSVTVIFGGPAVVVSADGIPLDTYPPAAAQTVVSLFALNGLSRLFLFFICVLALVRYRSAISLMFTVLLLNQLAVLLLLQFIPIVRTGTPPGPLVNIVLLALSLVGLALSLWHRGDRSTSRAVPNGTA